MTLDDVTVVGEPLVRADDIQVDELETRLGVSFPNGYRQYITALGEGVLGGSYIRIYPPWRILDELQEWRQRIEEYWFWDEGRDVLSKQQALESIILGDTLDGDEVIFRPQQPQRILVLPRHSEQIYVAGDDLWQAISWLCSSGTLTEAFEERDFEPFDSRAE